MTKEEDEKRGNLTITANYLELAQALENVIYMAQNLKDKLDISAIQKGLKKRDRRVNRDRRGGLN